MPQITKNVLLIVAHPDDETLWAGGTILSNPSWNCFVISLCRKNDSDRASKFYAVLRILNAKGIMGDMDDGPEQKPLDQKDIKEQIMELIPPSHFHIVITHNPNGEYTRHLRHEETSRAVQKLWEYGQLLTDELWLFAYEDRNKEHLPMASIKASIYNSLSKEIWWKKYSLITITYGFNKNDWEAIITPKAEAFWTFTNPAEISKTDITM